MPKAYSEDLRKRVVSVRRSGKSVGDVASMFGVSRPCVYRWDAARRALLVHRQLQYARVQCVAERDASA